MEPYHQELWVEGEDILKGMTSKPVMNRNDLPSLF